MQVATQNSTVPKLRFKEFDENWAFKKFRHLVKINQGLQIPISERYLSKVDNSHFYITNEFLKSNSEKKYYIKNPNDSVLCDVNDVLMTRTGNTGMVVTNVKGAFHNNFFKIAYPNTINKNFLVYFLNHTNTQNTIKRLAGTSTIPDLNHSDFYRIDFPIIGLPEQEKIASFLSAVDDRIQKLERKKSLLEVYKKGLMRQLFSQEIRFKDENGNNYPDWEEKKLGDVFNGIKGKGLSKDKLDENGLNKCILYGELYTRYPEKIDVVINRTNSNEGVNSKKGDLLVPCSTTTSGIDLANVTAINEDTVKLGGDISILRAKVVLNNVFYAYYLSNYKKHDLAKYGQGTTIVHLYFSHFKSMKIDIPQIEEQQKIASFLNVLDKKIELVDMQIQQSKTFKKGLLQQLFV